MNETFTKLSSELKVDVDNCFASINLRVTFTSKSILPIGHKHVVPVTKKVILFMNSSATVIVGT